MSDRRRHLAATAVLTALAAAGPVQAASVSSTKVRSPQVAINADGATVVAWERLSKRGVAIEARAGDGPLEFGRTRHLARSGHQPQVAVGADGTKAVMWSEVAGRGIRSIRVAIARPLQGFGRPLLVERRKANMRVVGIAVQPSGRVVAIWQRSAKRLAFALARRNHAFGKPRGLATIHAPAAGTIPVDPRDGSVVVAYGTPVSASPPTNQQAAVRTLALSGKTFSAPAVISQGPGTTPLDETYPALASGPAGVAVTFVQVGDPYTLSVVRRNGDGSWATAERVPTMSPGPGVFPSGLRAALPASGAAVAAWSLDLQGGGLGGTLSNQIVASVAGPAAAFGPPQPVTAAGGHFAPPAVAAAGDEAFVATAEPHGRVLLATRSAGAAAFGTPDVLADSGDGDVLLAAAGDRVLVAYQRNDALEVEVVR